MRLNELLKYNDIVIQCHDNPDADALASGYALWWYFKNNKKNARLIYRGKNVITKSNITIMLDKLKIPVSYEPDFADTPELLITVDCQYGQRNITKTPAKHIAIIDHHQAIDELPEYSEIKNAVGSASTVVWDLLKKEGVDVNDEPLLATALYYGLYTDTNKLSEISHPLDKDMQDELVINRSIIVEMSNSNISLDELKVTGNAILNYEYFEKNKYMIIKSEPCDPNILGVMSDFSLETAGVDVCLSYYIGQSEVKFSVRSCIKEVHADELAAFLAKGLGGGGGHMYKAGGKLRPEKLMHLFPMQTDEQYAEFAAQILHERMEQYFDSYEIIYAKEMTLDTSEMKKYAKTTQELGYVKLDDIFPDNTEITVRTLEGDMDVLIDTTTYLMIGLNGEVYPISESKLRSSYKTLDKPFNKTFEYAPSIRNTATGKKKTVMSFAKTAISVGKETIYSKPLTKKVKLFTAVNEERYYSGEIGDYIAFREDDPHYIFIVQADLFPILYHEV
ncbi:MAG: DHH family phosphoesterase [Butyrivibrio sp.]|nr:DHH family phosphoesterase [Butyrivibrio sp.]